MSVYFINKLCLYDVSHMFGGVCRFGNVRSALSTFRVPFMSPVYDFAQMGYVSSLSSTMATTGG